MRPFDDDGLDRVQESAIDRGAIAVVLMAVASIVANSFGTRWHRQECFT